MLKKGGGGENENNLCPDHSLLKFQSDQNLISVVFATEIVQGFPSLAPVKISSYSYWKKSLALILLKEG